MQTFSGSRVLSLTGSLPIEHRCNNNNKLNNMAVIANPGPVAKTHNSPIMNSPITNSPLNDSPRGGMSAIRATPSLLYSTENLLTYTATSHPVLEVPPSGINR
ncbi:hypothetical protein AVEN_208038-1 [Araneus ventricosus]|uniref:Uncharacterized protein n=1 Tax=Araneus ventricosus TaxID=182803 RepID=A0A4Y2F435_ARAVE|nr:hypothetical protein AVEN_208038-1 [Araneus ventricosus]